MTLRSNDLFNFFSNIKHNGQNEKTFQQCLKSAFSFIKTHCVLNNEILRVIIASWNVHMEPNSSPIIQPYNSWRVRAIHVHLGSPKCEIMSKTEEQCITKAQMFLREKLWSRSSFCPYFKRPLSPLSLPELVRHCDILIYFPKK